MPELVKQQAVVSGLDRAADDERPSEAGKGEQPSRHGGRKGCGQAPGYTGDACGCWAFVDRDDRHDVRAAWRDVHLGKRSTAQQAGDAEASIRHERGENEKAVRRQWV
jgi:hypothetical protein